MKVGAILLLCLALAACHDDGQMEARLAHSLCEGKPYIIKDGIIQCLTPREE